MEAPHQASSPWVEHTETSFAAPPMANLLPQGAQRTHRAARFSRVITCSALHRNQGVTPCVPEHVGSAAKGW